MDDQIMAIIYKETNVFRNLISNLILTLFKKKISNLDDNTWFNSSLKLNKTDILQNIQPKTKSEYDNIGDLRKTFVRSKTMAWPFCSEYTDKFELNSKI
jgi:hypothetical protein